MLKMFMVDVYINLIIYQVYHISFVIGVIKYLASKLHNVLSKEAKVCTIRYLEQTDSKGKRVKMAKNLMT